MLSFLSNICCKGKSNPVTMFLLFVLVLFSLLIGENNGLKAQTFQELYTVSSPTAGILPHGGYLFHGSVGPSSSLLFQTMIGFYDRLMVGVSFGLQKFVGRGDIDLNDKPGFQLRLRVIEEDVAHPALSLGINTQGEDSYDEEGERYERKSKGFYFVVSKNYKLIKDLSIHGGINYSLERKDEGGFNAFGAVVFEVFEGFSILVDYNAALDDNDTSVPSHRTRGKGYLDCGIRFDYMDNIRIKMLFKDLLDNYIPEQGVARTLEIFYVNYF